jgi:protein ImuB
VVSAAGPWRVQGEWWHDGAFARDYYDVQLSDGVLYRLYFDRRQEGWFVDGLYD